MKKILFTIVVLASISAYSQNKKAIKYFDKGVAAFNVKDYKLADSLFTISAKLEPNADTYFNLAAVKNEMGNRCGFCENLRLSIALGNKDAIKISNKNCMQYDTLHYTNTTEPGAVYYCVCSQQYCSKNKRYDIYKEENIKGEIRSISNYVDTNNLKVSDFYQVNFEVEKFYKENLPYLVVSEMPNFPGGDFARLQFIMDHMVYPISAKQKNIQGAVFTNFIVETDGTLTDIKTTKGIGGGCDEECIRIIKLMPKWIPGKHNGKLVRVQYTFPIMFILN